MADNRSREEQDRDQIIGRELKFDSFSSIAIDNGAGAGNALKHLYSLGHRRIAFIRGPKTIADSAPRWEGICAFAHKASLDLDPDLIVERAKPFPGYSDAYQLVQQLLRYKPPFTAIMAFDDLTAFAAIRALSNAGLRVPDDCSVIGFDDVAMAAYYNPPLTTVRQPMETMGSISVAIHLEAIRTTLKKNAIKPVHRKVVPRLMIRESTASPAGK